MADFPVAPGVPTYNRTAIHEVWSARILEKFYAATVLAAISNTSYEGEIKDMGSSVQIRTRPDVAVRKYIKGQKLQYQKPEPSTVELPIDKGYYWATEVNDVDKIQSDIALQDEFSADAAEQVKIQVDTDVFSTTYLDVPAANKGATAGAKSGTINLGTTGSAISITKSNVIDYIAFCAQVLDEQNVPGDGRWMTIPAWMRTHVITSDLKDASITGDGTSTLRNGRMGKIDRFTLYHSNLTATASDGGVKWRVPFGQKTAIGFAAQFTKTESLRSQDDFADLVRGLMVCGWKVIKPEALGELYCSRG